MARVQNFLRADRGAAVVELTIAASLLLTLLLGIVSYGVLLSFKQGMTQVAAEAARAAAVADSNATAVATSTATAAAKDVLDRTCDAADDDGFVCTVTSAGGRIRVEVVHDQANHPLVPPIPLLSSVLPAKVRAVSSVKAP